RGLALGARTPAEPRSWAEAYGEVLACLADHLPRLAVGPAERWSLHRRLLSVIERFRATDPGPDVQAHGDFHPTNLLFDPDGSLRALVDFQLSCEAPASMDSRWPPDLDAESLLDAYGPPRARHDEARWLGLFFEMTWLALGMVSTLRFGGVMLGLRYWVAYARHLERLVGWLGADRLRRRQANSPRRSRRLPLPGLALRCLGRRAVGIGV